MRDVVAGERMNDMAQSPAMQLVELVCRNEGKGMGWSRDRSQHADVEEIRIGRKG